MLGNIQQHESTSMNTNGHHPLWSYNGDVDEIQLYETQYPASEWDQNLDLLLDELQESVSSPQRAVKGRNKMTLLPSISTSKRQSTNKPVSSSSVSSSSQFLALAEEALRQTAIARRLLESIGDEPTVPSYPTSASSSPSSQTIACSQSSEQEALSTDNAYRLTPKSENDSTATSVSERAKAWTTRGAQTIQPELSPSRKVSLVDGGKCSTEPSPTAEGLRSFKLHPATVKDIETALNNVKIATDSKKILNYTEHMEYTKVPSNSDILEVNSEEKPAESIAHEMESSPKYTFGRKFSTDSLKILEFTDLLSSKKVDVSVELHCAGTDQDKLLIAKSNNANNQKTLEDKVKGRTTPWDVEEWTAKLAQLDSALNLLMEGLGNQ